MGTKTVFKHVSEKTRKNSRRNQEPSIYQIERRTFSANGYAQCIFRWQNSWDSLLIAYLSSFEVQLQDVPWTLRVIGSPLEEAFWAFSASFDVDNFESVDDEGFCAHIDYDWLCPLNVQGDSCLSFAVAKPSAVIVQNVPDACSAKVPGDMVHCHSGKFNFCFGTWSFWIVGNGLPAVECNYFQLRIDLIWLADPVHFI